MYRGNTAQILTDAATIAQRLRDHQVTLTGLMREYGSGHSTIMRAVHSQMCKAEYRRIVHHNITTHNLATRFQPGHPTWNKDLKGIHLSPQSEFKKGGPLRGFAARKWRPVGVITIRHDTLFKWQKKRRYKTGETRKGKPRRWIKVRDDGPPQKRFIPYARYLWQKRNGPIPDGYIVVHKDGNQMHDAIDNLILVDRRRHISRTCHTDPEVKARAYSRACESLTRNAHFRRLLRAASADCTQTWHCPACGATYEQLAPPARCEKCSAASFERLVISQHRIAL